MTADAEPETKEGGLRPTYEQLAGMIDHAVLHPTATDADLVAGCDLAARYRVASVCVKPCDVRRAAELLRGTGVRVGCVVGFPHGANATEVKRFETETACRDGAVEIDVVINVGRAVGGDFAAVEGDLRAVCAEAHRHGATVKAILETGLLAAGGGGLGGDSLKARLCGICERAGADWVKTSTGFGFVRRADGAYEATGATAHDLAMLRASCSDRVGVKASGGVRDLDGLIRARELGCTRCGTSATAAILDEFRRREAAGTGSGVPGRLGGPEY